MKEMINDVYINGIKIDLTRPLEIDIEEMYEAEYKYMVSNEEFHIYGIGKTKEEAINDLKKYFDFLYKEYGLCSDIKLEKLALEYKKKVLQIIGADSDIWIVPVREMAYEDAKNEIIEYRNNYNNTWISELVGALWLDIELVIQIVEDIDNDFDFDRFLVKGIFVFECHTIEKVVAGKDMMVGIQVNDDNDFTDFGISIKDYGKYYRDHVLPSYQNEKEIIGELLDNVARIVCNIIDMVEGNKDDLDIKSNSPTRQQNEKRIKKGLPLIFTVVFIKPRKQLLEYLEKFERDYRRSGYSHKFVVRGHWRYFRSEFYKSVHGQRIWITPS